MASSQNNNPTNARTFYQQNVCNFLSSQKSSISSPSSNTTSWIDHTARSIALRSIASAASHEHDGDASEVSTAVPPRWDDFVCLTCGTLLFPPMIDTGMTSASSTENSTSSSNSGKKDNAHSGKKDRCYSDLVLIPAAAKIRLRTLKRGKTRRRRSSRYRALYFQKLQQLRQDSSNSNVSKLLRKDGIAELRNFRMAYMFRLGDGTSKQCLVMKCGYCGGEKKFKGVDVCVRNGRRGDLGVSRGGGGIDRVGDATTATAATATIGTNTKKFRGLKSMDNAQLDVDGSVESQIRQGSNYISLGSLSESKSSENGKRKQIISPQLKSMATSNNGGTASVLSSLLGRNKKKKKTKNDKNKKSNLMDFLSSLND